MNFQFFYIVDVNFLALNLVKVKEIWLLKNEYPLYFQTNEIFSLAYGGDDELFYFYL